MEIDSGTLCRAASPVPSLFGTPTLKLEELTLDTSVEFRLTIQEALRRGARTAALDLLRTYQSATSAGAQGSAPNDPLRQLASMMNTSIVRQEEEAFSQVIREEIDSLPAGFVGDKDAVKDEDHYRYQVRPIYYAYGYTAPADILSKMTKHSVLGKSATWVHQDYAAILGKVSGVLDKWRQGLAADMGRQVKSVLGLQIRPIAGSNVLSNHALGCAIDIDAYSNPRMYGPLVIDVFNYAAKKGGINFDFGESVLSDKERGNGDYTEDDIMEILNRVMPASNSVRHWLRLHLPRYRRLLTKIEGAEKQLKTKHSTTSPLEKRLAEDEAAAKRVADRDAADVRRAETLAANRKSQANTGGACEPPPPGPSTAALEQIRSAVAEINSNHDLFRIQTLYENYEVKYIDTWEKEGVISIPLYLAAALVGPLKLQWGEQYKTSKDGMHFELIKPGSKRHEPYVAADSPLARGEKPRTLQRLLDNAFEVATAGWLRKDSHKHGRKQPAR